MNIIVIIKSNKYPMRESLPMLYRRNGEYVVIPAQSNGAAASNGKFLGILHTKCSLTVTKFE